MKEAKDKYTKKVTSPFILGESSVTYRAPQGFFGSFGAKEKNVWPDPFHMDDEYDDADEGETSSSCKMVKIKKPKKGFIDNEVVFTDEEMEIDSTLKNNISKNIEKLQEEDLNISKLMDSSDKDEVFDTDKKVQNLLSKYKGIFVQLGDSDGQKSELDASSERDGQKSGHDASSERDGEKSGHDASSERDGEKSELDASSERDVHSVGDDNATYIGDKKIDT